jgi:hypothetical protein
MCFHLLGGSVQHVQLIQWEICDALVLWKWPVYSGRSPLYVGYMEMYVCTVKVFYGNVCVYNGRYSKTLVLWKWSVFV